MGDALRTLGATVDEERDADGSVRWRVGGLGRPPSGYAEVYCGMGATVGRFLVPMLAAGQGRFEIDAHAQLRRRPLGPVLQALRAQGAVITGEAFPLVLEASGLAGGEVEVDGSISSQFLSGLLMAAPFARADTRLHFDTLVSKPYLDLTLDAMRAFGVEVDVTPDAMSVARGGYAATDFAVEPDASTASYFLGSAAITGTTVRLPGLDRRATAQGDIELVNFLEQMGCTVHDGEALELTGPERLRGVTVNMGNSSDVFMTLACVAVFADGPTTIEGIGHARVKESDRIAACAENLRRLGIEVEEGRDYIRIQPGVPQADTQLPTYEDHRIAMAFSHDRRARAGDPRGADGRRQDLPRVLRALAGDRRGGADRRGRESMVIAIDGPAGAGKSTVARAVAAALRFTYLDSGAMYRCVALAALRSGEEPAAAAERIRIELGERVLLDGEDVTEAIRAPEVSERASEVAAEPAVRRAMVAQQRRLLASGDWVAEGRDIGTVVAPDAKLKVFLTADPAERARRRAAQLGVDPETVLAEQTIRDERDRTRADSPLRPADGAIELDTTGLTLEQVVQRIVALVHDR